MRSQVHRCKPTVSKLIGNIDVPILFEKHGASPTPYLRDYNSKDIISLASKEVGSPPSTMEDLLRNNTSDAAIGDTPRKPEDMVKIHDENKQKLVRTEDSHLQKSAAHGVDTLVAESS